MTDRSETLTPDQLEAEADRARERLGSTVDELLLNLHPKSLASEWAQSSGFSDKTPAETIELAYRRHPVAITLCGIGLGLFAFATTRRAASSSPPGRPNLRESLSDSVTQLGDAVATVIRERARRNSERLLKVAETQVAATTDRVSDAVERSLEGWLSKIPGSPAAQPLVTSAVQLLLATALQAILRK